MGSAASAIAISGSLFGLTGGEGNHGEDVKEYYFYLDSTPTHSYMRFLYKYPQAEFPYAHLVEENRKRDRSIPEFELIETGVFAGGRYFDVEVEYAKGDPEDILILVHVTNRGPGAARIDVLATIWRNTWSWDPDVEAPLVELLPGEAPCPGADRADVRAPLATLRQHAAVPLHL